MSKVIEMESPYVSVRLLRSLKGFFTLKELESMLNIPYQVIWRYISFKNMPERATARKIIMRVEELGLIDKALDRNLVVNSHGYVETWRLLNSFNFLELMGYQVTKFVGGEEINAVVSYPPSASPLALISSDWLRSKACTSLNHPDLSVESYHRASYVSHDRGGIVDVYLPGSTIRRGDRILLVRDILNNLESIEAILEILDSIGADLWGIFSILSVSDEWKKGVEGHGIKRVKVFREIAT